MEIWLVTSKIGKFVKCPQNPRVDSSGLQVTGSNTGTRLRVPLLFVFFSQGHVRGLICELPPVDKVHWTELNHHLWSDSGCQCWPCQSAYVSQTVCSVLTSYIQLKQLKWIIFHSRFLCFICIKTRRWIFQLDIVQKVLIIIKIKAFLLTNARQPKKPGAFTVFYKGSEYCKSSSNSRVWRCEATTWTTTSYSGV